MPIDIEVFNSIDDCPGLRETWNTLVLEDARDLRGLDGTSTLEWYESILDAFPEAEDSRVIIARKGGKIVGLLPIVIAAKARLGTHLLAPTNLYDGRNGPVVPHSDPEILEQLLAGVNQASPGWTSFSLMLVEGMHEPLEHACRKLGYRFLTTDHHQSPYFPVCPSPEEFLANASKGIKQLLRTAGRKLEAAGPHEFRYFGHQSDTQDLLAAILSVESRSWKQAAGTAITNHPRQQAFLRAMLDRAARGGLLFSMVLYLEGDPIAYNLGIRRSGVFSCLKHSHVETHDKLSPAYLVTMKVIDCLRAEGSSVFDFMGLPESHKLRWSSQTRLYMRKNVTVFNRHWIGIAKYAYRRARLESERRETSATRGDEIEGGVASPEPASGVGSSKREISRPICVEVLTKPDDWPGLRDAWNAMVRDDPATLHGQDATSTHEWYMSIAAAFPEASTTRIAVARRDTEIVGILPLMEGSGGLLARQLHSPVRLYGGRNGPRVKSGDASVLVALLESVDSMYPGWTSIEFDLVAGGTSEGLLATACATTGLKVLKWEYQNTPFFPLAESESAFCKSMKRDLLQRIRSGARNLSSIGAVHYRTYSAPTDAEELLSAILAVERNSWKHETGTAISNSARQQDFYRKMFPRMFGAEMLVAMVLWLDEKPIAFQFGTIRDAVFCSLKISFDQAYAGFSPSHLVRYKLINWLRERGFRTYDSTGLPEAHQFRWSRFASTYARWHWHVFNRTALGQLALSKARVRHELRRLESHYGDTTGAKSRDTAA